MNFWSFNSPTCNLSFPKVLSWGTSVLSIEDELQISNENTTYVLEQPYKSAIEDYIFRRQNVMSDLTIDLLLKEAVEKPTERHTRSDQLQVSSILREMGYTKKKKRVEGSLKWVYSRDSLVSWNVPTVPTYVPTGWLLR